MSSLKRSLLEQGDINRKMNISNNMRLMKLLYDIKMVSVHKMKIFKKRFTAQIHFRVYLYCAPPKFGKI